MAPCGAGAVFFFALAGLNFAIHAMVAPGVERSSLGCVTGLRECIVGQVVNLRRIGNPLLRLAYGPRQAG